MLGDLCPCMLTYPLEKVPSFSFGTLRILFHLVCFRIKNIVLRTGCTALLPSLTKGTKKKRKKNDIHNHSCFHAQYMENSLTTVPYAKSYPRNKV